MLARERISMMRKQKGITTTEMGRLLDVSQGTISRYESGMVKVIPYDKLTMIASIFGCSVAELVKGDSSYSLLVGVEKDNSEESVLVTDREDIELLKWFHGLSNSERLFIKKLFDSKEKNVNIMIIQS